MRIGLCRDYEIRRLAIHGITWNFEDRALTIHSILGVRNKGDSSSNVLYRIISDISLINERN